MTELEAGDSLSINAAKGVVADYRANGGLQSSLNELAKNPATAWVAQIAKRDDVTWQAVQEAHQSWNYSSQGLSGPAAAVIAIAVAIATQGAGAALLGAADGLGGAVGGAMANAAFTALVSQASISMINNRGNIGKVLQELGTVETAKNLAIAMASAGLTKGFADSQGFNDLMPQGKDIVARLGREALQQSLQTGSSLIANTAINGGDFGKNAVNALTLAAISTIGAVATQEIGNAYKQAVLDGQIDPLEYTLQKVAHARHVCSNVSASAGLNSAARPAHAARFCATAAAKAARIGESRVIAPPAEDVDYDSIKKDEPTRSENTWFSVDTATCLSVRKE
jgi:filamentous hemagglutinin